jgi:hypothetical protein
VPVDKMTVHNHLTGGGVGRRLEADMVASGAKRAWNRGGPGMLTAGPMPERLISAAV